MKFVKGVTIFLVLCLAAYGAFSLYKNFRRPPQIDVSENDRGYLEDLGIHIPTGRAADSGLSPLFGDIEDIEPIGAASGAAYSSPPGFFAEPTAYSVAPSFVEATPRVAVVVPELQVAPEFTPPIADPFSPAVPSPPANSFGETPLLPAPQFEAPLFESAVPATLPLDIPPVGGVPPVPATESPPPPKEGWDGPASDISRTPPPMESILPPTVIPPPISNTPEIVVPLIVESHPVVERIAFESAQEPVRMIGRETESNVLLVSTQVESFSSSDSVPVASPPAPVQHYTQTTVRQPLTFEPIKPDASPNAPVIVFAPPKQTGVPQEPPRVAVKTLGTPRLIDRPDTLPVPQTVISSAPLRNAPPPVEQSAVPETIERFIQSQRQQAESDDPDNIRRAFIQLSQLYEHEQLGEAERSLMLPILDALALKVIYARNTHILEPAYRVKPGETVESIADNFSLPPVLLRKINGLSPSHELSAGMVLKVVHGQFDARISIKRKELTLLLGGLYAGRFPFTLSNANVSAQRGDYFITKISGGVITLNNGWTLGTARAKDVTLTFADQHVREIFDILSMQSVIVLE